MAEGVINPVGYDYYGDRVRDPFTEHRRRVKYQIDLRREIRDNKDPFAISNTEFHRLYRMSQQQLLQITEILRPLLREKTGTTSIPVEIMTLCAVMFYAQGSYQRPHGRIADLNLSQSSVSNSIKSITDAFNHADILLRYIKFPRTQNERDVIIQRNARNGLPGVLGYIDGTLISVVCPYGPFKYTYRSRKGFYAINAQIVCDADLKILSFNAQFPGSSHDSWIYRRTLIRPVMREAFQQRPCWLLGDSAYPHEPWLQKPILHAEPGSPEFRYTRVHCKGRSSVERCIGVLKGRWRCLRRERALHYQPTKTSKIANACVVLYNYLREAAVPDPDPYLVDDVDDVPDLDVEEDNENLLQLNQANAVRDYLIQAAQQ